MITIQFFEIDALPEIESVSLIAANTALQDQDADLSIVFCDNRYIQELNAQFRDFNQATDVLSFPSDEVDPDSGKRYLGDIVISYPQAFKQAEEAGNPLISEISMLVIHGILHLRGYDHTTPADKSEMWKQQADLLLSLGIVLEKFTGDQ